MYKSDEYQYLDIMQSLMMSEDRIQGRNGWTRRQFGAQMRFDLNKGFPLLTTKKVHFKSIIVELLWFLSGDTNTDYLKRNGVTIWDEWAGEDGELGPIYGAQWRGFGAYDQYGSSARIPGEGIDQILNVIESLKKDPYSRRHIVSAWNPLEMHDMALPPCHMMFQFQVSSDNKLSCHLYQRSADWFLGVPFNIASYALLTHLIANEVGLDVGDFVHSFGDLHLYENHIEAAEEQVYRIPYDFPKLTWDKSKSIFDLVYTDISVDNYKSHPAIRAEVSA